MNNNFITHHSNYHYEADNSINTETSALVNFSLQDALLCYKFLVTNKVELSEPQKIFREYLQGLDDRTLVDYQISHKENINSNSFIRDNFDVMPLVFSLDYHDLLTVYNPPVKLRRLYYEDQELDWLVFYDTVIRKFMNGLMYKQYPLTEPKYIAQNINDELFTYVHQLHIGLGAGELVKPFHLFSYQDFHLIRTVFEGDYVLQLKHDENSYFDIKEQEKLIYFRRYFLDAEASKVLISTIEKDNNNFPNRKFPVRFDKYNPVVILRNSIDAVQYDWNLMYNAAIYIASFRFPHLLPFFLTK